MSQVTDYANQALTMLSADILIFSPTTAISRTPLLLQDGNIGVSVIPE
jgi:hypothetical protein